MWSYTIKEMGNNDRKLWFSFERNKEPYGVKYTGGEATNEKSYTRDQETVLVFRLLIRPYSFHCVVVLQLAHLLTPLSPPVTELHKHR